MHRRAQSDTKTRAGLQRIPNDKVDRVIEHKVRGGSSGSWEDANQTLIHNAKLVPVQSHKTISVAYLVRSIGIWMRQRRSRHSPVRRRSASRSFFERPAEVGQSPKHVLGAFAAHASRT